MPLAFDVKHNLLYVACRTPGTLIAIDTTTGKEVAGQPAASQADDLFYDALLNRVYLISGAGEIDTYQVDDANGLHPLEALYTAAGAKTALFVPSQNLLYLGVPSVDGHPAEIRIYSTATTRGN